MVGLDRLAVPVEPAIVIDRQPAEIGHVDRMVVAPLWLGPKQGFKNELGDGLRSGRRRGFRRQQIEDVVVQLGVVGTADVRTAGTPIGHVRISGRIGLRSRIIGALAQLAKGRKETHRAPWSPRRARKSKRTKAAVAAFGGQVKVWTAKRLTPEYRRVAAAGAEPDSRSGMRRSCSPSREPRRSRRWPCRWRRWRWQAPR